jgi:phosphoglycolate phosphatase
VPGRPQAHQEALIGALVEVYGIEVGDGENPVADVEPWGKTDRQIVRDILRPRGLSDSQIDSSLARFERRACELHAGAREPSISTTARERAAEALEELRDAGHSLALLTGNLEPIAWQKMEACGLAGFFARGQGGFGSDAESRPDLVRIARERFGRDGRPHPVEDTLLVGDTPLDVAAAHVDGVRCAAITGRRFGARELRESGADWVIDELGQLVAIAGRA